jgi:hypothetical protein
MLGIGLQLDRTSFLSLTAGGGGGEIPATAIFFNGVPILYNGNYLTYN